MPLIEKVPSETLYALIKSRSAAGGFGGGSLSQCVTNVLNSGTIDAHPAQSLALAKREYGIEVRVPSEALRQRLSPDVAFHTLHITVPDAKDSESVRTILGSDCEIRLVTSSIYDLNNFSDKSPQKTGLLLIPQLGG